MHNRKSITGKNCEEFKDLCLCQKRTQQTIFKSAAGEMTLLSL